MPQIHNLREDEYQPSCFTKSVSINQFNNTEIRVICKKEKFKALLIEDISVQ